MSYCRRVSDSDEADSSRMYGGIRMSCAVSSLERGSRGGQRFTPPFAGGFFTPTRFGASSANGAHGGRSSDRTRSAFARSQSSRYSALPSCECVSTAALA